MAVEYFCAYYSYLDALEPLTDAERGRLFVACLKYSKSGEVEHLSGNERFVFPVFRGQIDRDNAKYASKCKKQADNANKRWNKDDANDAMAYDGIPNVPPHEKDANDAKEKEKEKEKEKDIKKEKEKNALAAFGFGEPLSGRILEWLRYKAERHEGYKPQGLHSLLRQIDSCRKTYGEDALCELIQQSMANGWKGIIFDRLAQSKPGSARNGGTRQLDDAERAAIERVMGGHGLDGTNGSF